MLHSISYNLTLRERFLGPPTAMVPQGDILFSMCRVSRSDGCLRICMFCCCLVVCHIQLVVTPCLQHTRPPCPSLSPGVCPNSCPLSRWCLQPSSVAERRSQNLHYVFSKSVLRQLLYPRAVLVLLALIPFLQNRDTKCFIFFLLHIAPMHSNAYLSTTVFHSWNRTSTSFTFPFPMSWKA